jgi:hypothetical protein
MTMKETKFYEITQNNSGGSFVTDDKLCHRMFIEAESYKEAVRKAEDMGCYWDGVEDGMDCPCCGDRWYRPDEVNFAGIVKKYGGYPVSKFIYNMDDATSVLKGIYEGLEWHEEPKEIEKYSSPYVEGVVKLRSIEDYAQVVANMFGWEGIDSRIFYKDGSVKVIFRKDY